jgi:hypothetical protein
VSAILQTSLEKVVLGDLARDLRKWFERVVKGRFKMEDQGNLKRMFKESLRTVVLGKLARWMRNSQEIGLKSLQRRLIKEVYGKLRRGDHFLVRKSLKAELRG